MGSGGFRFLWPFKGTCRRRNCGPIKKLSFVLLLDIADLIQSPPKDGSYPFKEPYHYQHLFKEIASR